MCYCFLKVLLRNMEDWLSTPPINIYLCLPDNTVE